MYQFKELTGLTRIAIGALWVYMVSNTIAQASGFYVGAILGRISDPNMPGPVDFLSLLNLLVLFITAILVGRWIYRASANVHAVSDGLSITPGWAVGWYFVPFANLWKPFQAMKEIWLASHFGNNWGAGEATDLLNWGGACGSSTGSSAMPLGG